MFPPAWTLRGWRQRILRQDLPHETEHVTPQRDPPPGLQRLAPALSFGVLAGCLVFIFSRSMDRGLDHDEHQFIASATAWSRGGLMPYRDFPHFHMPYLVFLYGCLDQLFSRPFLTARLMSAACAWGLVLLLHGAVRRAACETLKPWGTHLLASGAALMLLFNPLFTYTSGLAWNHDLALILAWVAFLCAMPPARSERQPAPWACGLALGLAVGVRLSMAPLAAPMLIALYRWRAEGGALTQRPAQRVLRFCAGGLAALLPALGVALLAPARALFGNFQYPALNTAYRVDQGFERAMNFPGKFQYLMTEVVALPSHLLLLGLLLMVGWSGLRNRSGPGHGRLQLVALCLPFLFVGALAPTPSWYQYFYALVPFLLLAASLGMLGLFQAGRPRPAWVACALFASCLGASVLHSLPDYRTLSNLADTSSWAPERAATLGHELREHIETLTASARLSERESPLVLTLSPIPALEAGLRADPAFASGPFAWRSARFVPPEERHAQGLVGPEELDAYLDEAAEPPSAVLSGAEPQGEDPLREWAGLRGYVSRTLQDGMLAQIRPLLAPPRDPPRHAPDRPVDDS